jgi:hypothetical protein
MSRQLRIGLVLVLSAFVGFAYSPASFADKKGNASNSDDKKDKDKDNDQNNQRSRGRNRDDDQKSSNQQFQFNPKNSQNKQGDSSNSQKLIIGNGQQGNQFQKSQQFQKFQNQQSFQNNQKKGDSQQDKQKNVQLQVVPNKPDWISKSHNDKKDVKNFVVKFGGPEPFSKKWYDDHPKAWHHHHDHDDAWKVVTAAGIVGFLGWEAYHPRTVVVYQPVPYDVLWASRPGVVIDPNRGEWAPLGRFSLMLGPGDNSTRMLDLSVDRFGRIRGSYYDMVSDTSHNVAGIIDQRSQYAQWSLESNRGLTFYTPLGEMMQPQGLVFVQLPSGERQQWQLVRMDSGGY